MKRAHPEFPSASAEVPYDVMEKQFLKTLDAVAYGDRVFVVYALMNMQYIMPDMINPTIFDVRKLAVAFVKRQPAEARAEVMERILLLMRDAERLQRANLAEKKKMIGLKQSWGDSVMIQNYLPLCVRYGIRITEQLGRWELLLKTVQPRFCPPFKQCRIVYTKRRVGDRDGEEGSGTIRPPYCQIGCDSEVVHGVVNLVEADREYLHWTSATFDPVQMRAAREYEDTFMFLRQVLVLQRFAAPTADGPRRVQLPKHIACSILKMVDTQFMAEWREKGR
jgi:hypothetical protein